MKLKYKTLNSLRKKLEEGKFIEITHTPYSLTPVYKIVDFEGFDYYIGKQQDSIIETLLPYLEKLGERLKKECQTTAPYAEIEYYGLEKNKSIVEKLVDKWDTWCKKIEELEEVKCVNIM